MIGQIGALYMTVFAIVGSLGLAIYQAVSFQWTISLGTAIIAGAFLLNGLITLRTAPAQVKEAREAITAIKGYIEAHEKWSKEYVIQLNSQISKLIAIQESSDERINRVEKWIDNGHHRSRGAGGD